MADEGAASSLAGQTRPLDVIVRLTVERCLRDLGAVAREAAGGDLGSSKEGAPLGSHWGPLDEDSRKLALLRYLHCTKQKILRLLVLCRWSAQVRYGDICEQAPRAGLPRCRPLPAADLALVVSRLLTKRTPQNASSVPRPSVPDADSTLCSLLWLLCDSFRFWTGAAT